MSDKLKQHIEENKDQFQFELKRGHEFKFEQKLNTSSPQKNTNLSWLKVAAAIVAIVSLAGTIFYAGMISNQPEVADKPQPDLPLLALQNVSSDMEEVETYYKNQIKNEKKKAIVAVELNPELKVFFEELNHLEQQYQLLREELTRNQNNDRIIQSMIRNYQLRLSLLQKLLIKTKEKNQLKNRINENV